MASDLSKGPATDLEAQLCGDVHVSNFGIFHGPDRRLKPYLGANTFDQAGERVVEGQRVLQAAGDVFLGWSRFNFDSGSSYDFYVCQLWDGKGSAEVDDSGDLPIVLDI